MKISTISSYPNKQSFQGLSKMDVKVKDETYYEPAYEADLGTHTTKTTIYYYPFADETQEQIDNFVKENTFREAKTPSNPNLSDQTTRIIETVVKVQKPLALTKQDYDNYVESMINAKKLYEENADLMRQTIIRALADDSAIETENKIMDAGLDNCVFKA